jgi:thiol-disulfide isomerase/thioredoxin
MRKASIMKTVWVAALLAVAVAVGIIAMENKVMTQETAGTAARLPTEGTLPLLSGAIGWLNSKPLAAADLRGKVVLVEFWTYSCINWLRIQPYVRAWDEKYRDKGLVVIGVHTPEFGFEKDLDNIQWATKNLRVDYPVAIDSDYAVWRAFNNNYWPALYFIDAEGRIRHHQFGEGNYDQSERVIQELLAEAGMSGFDRALVSVEGRGLEAAADWDDIRSPETYAGYSRGDNFLSPGGAIADTPTNYTIPEKLALNYWAFSGNWTIKQESAALNNDGGRIAFRFHARDLNLVMGPPAASGPVRFRVLIDGKPLGASKGVDVDEEGNGTASEQRLYQLIRQQEPTVDRTFEIEFFDPGIEAFVFTFG